VSNASDWEKLTQEQQDAVDMFRNRIVSRMIAETEAFQRSHPTLRLNWSVTVDPIIRGGENDGLANMREL